MKKRRKITIARHPRKEQTTFKRERAEVRKLAILSTKILKLNQKELLLNAGISLVEYNAIDIQYLDVKVPSNIDNAIVTSKNAVVALENLSSKINNVFCVGEKTKTYLEQKEFTVLKCFEYGKELAEYITKYHKEKSFYFFCGNLRRDEIPFALREANIPLTEITTYRTTLSPKKFERTFSGILFFSPSSVESFVLENKLGNSIAFCIGDTTAYEAEKHFDRVVISNTTSIESVIAKAVKTLRNINTSAETL